MQTLGEMQMQKGDDSRHTSRVFIVLLVEVREE